MANPRGDASLAAATGSRSIRKQACIFPLSVGNQMRQPIFQRFLDKLPMPSSPLPSQEFRLLEKLSRFFHTGFAGDWIVTAGDDAAVRRSGNDLLVVTADTQVEGVHFRRENITMRELGRRAMAVNLSDCASMGALPDGAIVQLICNRQQTSERDILSLYRGLSDSCTQWHFPIVGGDLAQGPCLIVAITLFGRRETSQRVLSRRGVQEGDTLWTTGVPGESAAGRLAMERWGRPKVPRKYRTLVRKHVLPVPRIEAGLLLAQNPAVHAAIDISDGIAKDAATLCHENNLGLELYSDQLPAAAPIRALAAELRADWVEWFLSGGEDYELLFAADRSFNPDERFPVQLTAIGRFSSKTQGIRLVTPDGASRKLEMGGWDHFA